MSQYLITTTATLESCRRCDALLLTGYAEGLRARVNLTPTADEPAAIRAGLWTYNLRAGQLAYRGDFQRAHPPREPVLVEHRCPTMPIRTDRLF